MSSIGQNQRLPEVDPMFGTITCPECRMAWVPEFVPEFCTRCGVRVSLSRGEGCERDIRLIEKGLMPGKIIVCSRCGERYPDYGKATWCLRCWNDLPSLRQPITPRLMPGSPLRRAASCLARGLKRVVGL